MLQTLLTYGGGIGTGAALFLLGGVVERKRHPRALPPQEYRVTLALELPGRAESRPGSPRSDEAAAEL